MAEYLQSKIKQITNEVFKDPESVSKIDNAILNSEMFYRFLKYSFETHFYEIKENGKAFLNTLRAPIMKYGLKHKEELDSADIFAKDLTPEKIKSLSKGYPLNTIKTFQKDGKNILYTVATLFYLLNIHSSEKGEKGKKDSNA